MTTSTQIEQVGRSGPELVSGLQGAIIVGFLLIVVFVYTCGPIIQKMQELIVFSSWSKPMDY